MRVWVKTGCLLHPARAEASTKRAALGRRRTVEDWVGTAAAAGAAVEAGEGASAVVGRVRGVMMSGWQQQR